MIRSGLTSGTKVAIMTAVSLFAILIAWLVSGGNGWIDFKWPAVIPMVKRHMTLTFVLMSVGWTLLVFTYFYLIMDGFLMRTWALPLVVLGRNALFLFVTFSLFRDWAAKTALLVLPSVPAVALTLRPLFVELIVLAIYWLLCVWLYRRRIFFKV
jgi:predicted acyltransferase